MTSLPVLSKPATGSAAAGIGLMLAGIGLFALNDALGKWLLTTYSVGQLLLIRSLVALPLLAPFIWREGPTAFTSAPRPWLQVARAVLSTLEVAMFFWAVSYLPLADTVTFYLAGPIYVTALSVVLLGERVGWRRWTAVLVGFGGVLLALRPSAATVTLPALIALTGSMAFAFLMIVTRSLRATSNTVLVTSQIVGTLILGGLWAPFVWVTPTLGRPAAAVGLRRGVDRRARLRQLFAQARAGERGRAVSVHADRLGHRARLPGVRRRARRLHADRRGDHRRRRAVHLLARAGARQAACAPARVMRTCFNARA